MQPGAGSPGRPPARQARYWPVLRRCLRYRNEDSAGEWGGEAGRALSRTARRYAWSSQDCNRCLSIESTRPSGRPDAARWASSARVNQRAARISLQSAVMDSLAAVAQEATRIREARHCTPVLYARSGPRRSLPWTRCLSGHRQFAPAKTPGAGRRTAVPVASIWSSQPGRPANQQRLSAVFEDDRLMAVALSFQ